MDHFPDHHEPPPDQRERRESLPHRPQEFESSRILPPVRRKVLISRPFTLTEEDGSRRHITQVPSLFLVRKTGDKWLELADLAGNPVGKTERLTLFDDVVEWSSRTVMVTKEPLPMYETADAAADKQQSRSNGLLPAGSNCPVLEKRSVRLPSGNTVECQRIGPPFGGKADQYSGFPVWTSAEFHAEMRYGLLVEKNELRSAAAKVELAMIAMRRANLLDEKWKNLPPAIESLYDISWRLFAGEMKLAYTDTERELHRLIPGHNALGSVPVFAPANTENITSLTEKDFYKYVETLDYFQNYWRSVSDTRKDAEWIPTQKNSRIDALGPSTQNWQVLDYTEAF